MENKFTYNYSAKENAEIESIRKMYTPSTVSPIDELKALDGKKQECSNVIHMRNKTIFSLVRARKAKNNELVRLDDLLLELDAVERDILTCRYVLGLSWNECFSEMRKKKHYYSQRTMFRIHDAAIIHMAQAEKRKNTQKI